MTEKGYAAEDWLNHLGEPEPIPIDRPRLAEKPVAVEPSRRRDIPYRTPLEVAASTSEHPDWLLHGFVALGALTEVDGKIKSSGKTTFVTHLTAAILDGQPFLGQPTMRTNVVYLTEQTEATFREALGRAGLLARGVELRLVFRSAAHDRPTGGAWSAGKRHHDVRSRQPPYTLLLQNGRGGAMRPPKLAQPALRQ